MCFLPESNQLMMEINLRQPNSWKALDLQFMVERCLQLEAKLKLVTMDQRNRSSRWIQNACLALVRQLEDCYSALKWHAQLTIPQTLNSEVIIYFKFYIILGIDFSRRQLMLFRKFLLGQCNKLLLSQIPFNDCQLSSKKLFDDTYLYFMEQ